MRRTWAYSLTDGGVANGVGAVSVRFRESGLFPSTEPQDTALLLHDDGDFSGARVRPGRAPHLVEPEALELTDVVLDPRGYIALAVELL